MFFLQIDQEKVPIQMSEIEGLRMYQVEELLRRRFPPQFPWPDRFDSFLQSFSDQRWRFVIYNRSQAKVLYNPEELVSGKIQSGHSVEIVPAPPLFHMGPDFASNLKQVSSTTDQFALRMEPKFINFVEKTEFFKKLIFGINGITPPQFHKLSKVFENKYGPYGRYDIVPDINDNASTTSRTTLTLGRRFLLVGKPSYSGNSIPLREMLN